MQGLFEFGNRDGVVFGERVGDGVDAAHDAQDLFERFVGNGERVGVVVCEGRVMWISVSYQRAM